MKRRTILLLLVFILGTFSAGCGEPKLPDPNTELLNQVVRNELDNHFDSIGDWSYDVKNISRRGKTCKVDIEITAAGKYARFKIDGILNFTSNESKWDYTDGTLKKEEYTLTDHPDPNYLYPLAVDDIVGIYGDPEGRNFSLINSEIKKDGTMDLMISEQVDNSPVTYVCDYTRNFVFDPLYEEWIIDSNKDTEKRHSPKLENIGGVYHAKKEEFLSTSEVTVEIFDVTDESFKVRYPEENQNRSLEFHFSDQIYSDPYRCDLDESHYITVRFTERDSVNDRYYETAKNHSGDYMITFFRFRREESRSIGTEDISFSISKKSRTNHNQTQVTG